MHNFKQDFRFSPLISFGAVVLAGLMITASVWQWHRYGFKLELQEKFAAHSSEEAIIPSLEDLLKAPEKLLNEKIKLTGQFDLDRQMLVINRSNGRQAGFWLLAPFKLSNSDHSLLVSRGFIPFEENTPKKWKKYSFEELKDETNIEVVIQDGTPSRNWLAPMNPPGDTAEFKRKWSYVDVEAISKQFNYPLVPAIFAQEISPKSLNGFPEKSIQIGLPPSTHFWYSIEWILLAISSLAGGIALQMFPNRRKRLRENEMLRATMGLLFCFCCFVPDASATSRPEEVPDKAQVIERLGSSVDLSLEFRASNGETTTLAKINPNQLPILLAPVYYECPELCGLTQTGIAKMLNELDLKLGDDFIVVSLSFNPKETVEYAVAKAKLYREMLSNIPEQKRNAWHFLVGDESSIKQLTQQVGFYYAKDAQDFMHAAVLTALSPKGLISRYLYGIQFPVKNVRLALLEAADGKIGSFAQKVLMFCFRYDHIKGQYTLSILKITRILCLGFFFVLAACLLWLRMKERGSSAN